MRVFSCGVLIYLFVASVSCSQKKSKNGHETDPSAKALWNLDTRVHTLFGYYKNEKNIKGKFWTPALKFGKGAHLRNSSTLDFKKREYLYLRNVPASKTVLYQKYFRYPSKLSHMVSLSKVFDRFRLNTMKRIFVLKNQTKSAKNFVISHLVPNGKNKYWKTYPGIRNPNVIYQEQFDKNLVTTRFYLGLEKPVSFSNYSEVDQTRMGVNSFHREVLTYYWKKLKHLETNNKFHIFLSESLGYKVKVIRVAVQPESFVDNFRKYQLPYKKGKYYVTSLFPIHSDYYESDDLDPTNIENFEDIKKNFTLDSSQVLEIASVYKEF